MAPTFSCTAPTSNIPLFSKRTPLFKATVLKQHHHHLHAQAQPHAQANWTTLSSEINTHVMKSLPKTPPPSVSDPMHHLVSIAPPSIASALCLAACELVGGRKDQAMNAACAVQLMHAGAHTHGQLLFRKLQHSRGSIQLMTGDGILPLGYEMAARGGDPEKIVRVVLEMARAMGPQGVLEGQLMEAEGRGEELSAWERRGGRLAGCGAACGAIMGGGSEEDVERMRRFGMYVGMMMACMSHDSGSENVEMFRSLARLELQGFEEEKVDGVVGLFQLGGGAGCSEEMVVISR